MSWIDDVPPDAATGRLARTYAGACDPELGRPANVLTVHGIAPQVLDAHLALYRRVVKAPQHLPWYACEAVATVVSSANACRYCTVHHGVAFQRAVAAAGDAVEVQAPEAVARALARYGRTGDDQHLSCAPDPVPVLAPPARRWTCMPGKAHRRDLEPLRAAGLGDGAIFELVQVVAYFNYVNRVVLGLGVQLEPEYEAAHGSLYPEDP